MCVHSHPEALTCPTGELNTSPVNEVMLYLCGSQATETFCSPAWNQAGGSCLPSSLFLSCVGVSETLLKHNRQSDDGISGLKAVIAGLCVCKAKNNMQSSFGNPVYCFYRDRKILLQISNQLLSLWLPGCCLPVGEDLSVIGDIAEECNSDRPCGTSKSSSH